MKPGRDPSQRWGMGAFADSIAGRDRVADAGVTESERLYALFTHLSLLVVHITGIPVVPALILWLIRKDRSAFIDDHGREAVNFQISLTIYTLAIIPLALLSCGVAAVLYIPVYILAIYGMIVASIAAHKGQFYRYPMCVRLLR